eukprot:m.365955 g.365955  ORF g.365955 m.365955 type:complete len:147 (+) comp19974_c1_seq12:843-1283(+)
MSVDAGKAETRAKSWGGKVAWCEDSVHEQRYADKLENDPPPRVAEPAHRRTSTTNMENDQNLNQHDFPLDLLFGTDCHVETDALVVKFFEDFCVTMPCNLRHWNIKERRNVGQLLAQRRSCGGSRLLFSATMTVFCDNDHLVKDVV